MARQVTSSPLSSAPSSQATFRTATSQPTSFYRGAADLPHELLQHLQIYIEEALFTQGLRFSTSLITSSIASHGVVYIPPPQYLSVISTLAIHPSLTTRAATRDKSEPSIHALKLLNLINRTVGPANSQVLEAYRFRRFAARLGYDDGDVDGNGQDQQHPHRLISPYAEDQNVFALAEDFWSVVGWALNCACKTTGRYADRWKYWRPWLEYMLDVLESDWSLRLEQGAPSQSLMWQYVDKATGGNARARRMLRSIFADASNGSLAEFREIFPKELKGPKRERDEPKKQEVKVDVDEEIYADYMNVDESSTDEDDAATAAIASDFNARQPRAAKRLRTRTPSSRRYLGMQIINSSSGFTAPTRGDYDSDSADPSSHEVQSTTTTNLGPPAAVTARLRLLQLLSNVSSCVTASTTNPASADGLTPRLEFLDLHDLNTLFVEFIRPLPLSSFTQFVLSTRVTAKLKTCPLTTDAHLNLLLFLLPRLIEPSAPSHHKHMFIHQELTQQRLAEEFLPFAAGKATIDAQVRMSLCLEGVLRLCTTRATASQDSWRKTSAFTTAVRTGIQKRRDKAREVKEGGVKKSATAAEDEALEVLAESAARMGVILDEMPS